MTNWHYQLMKHVEDDGEEWYAVHEFYHMEDGPAWTLGPVSIEGTCIEDVKWQLENMLKDIDKHGLKDYT